MLRLKRQLAAAGRIPWGERDDQMPTPPSGPSHRPTVDHSNRPPPQHSSHAAAAPKASGGDNGDDPSSPSSSSRSTGSSAESKDSHETPSDRARRKQYERMQSLNGMRKTEDDTGRRAIEQARQKQEANLKLPEITPIKWRHGDRNKPKTVAQFRTLLRQRCKYLRTKIE